MTRPRKAAATAAIVEEAPNKAKRRHFARQAIDMAHELLANQPVTLAGLAPDVRSSVVISAVLDDVGNTVVVARVGDLVWEMWPFVKAKNVVRSETRLDWSKIPEAYREACQNVLYAYWKVGRMGPTRAVGTLHSVLRPLRLFCNYVASLGLVSFGDVQPLHIANYVRIQKAKGLKSGSLAAGFLALELLYVFRDEHACTLQIHPWPGSSAREVGGHAGQQSNGPKVGLTPLIPPDVARVLFRHAKSILNRAEELLDARDQGLRPLFEDPEILAIRDAGFYLIGVLTGMRCSELSSIECGAGRTEVKNGITFHWLSATEYKTKKGRVEYLMPAMGHDILRILERWSEPYRQRLSEEIAACSAKRARHTREELEWLHLARCNVKLLFFAKAFRPLSRITALSTPAAGRALKRFAGAAGTDWQLASHQMRRLYAYTFVRHRLGDMLFLKEQFKHASLDMTQLYAANPRQDAALYDDLLSELTIYKAGVVAQWLEKDEPLAGGAARKIKGMRANDFPGRKELLTEASMRVSIRSTGHSWCLAQDEGCGGSGIYEKGNCGDCGNGVIDRRFLPIWKEAYSHLQSLRTDAAQLGPGAVKRVERDLVQAAKILRDLGLEIDEDGKDATTAHG
ncbi:tyrosine-type recombinase/integrase (plasmid) [Ralstonia sp. 25C]|uniref:tyrosine-type recombinase/integrase n=1 Tax=Ralstonia sp. 25C TaxID=3447363 RepID=UPI003F74BED9